jgi:sulfur-oxidizing protein SoxZ
MRIRAKAGADYVEVKVLMSHPMETGQRKDAEGNLVPFLFITKVVVTCKDKEVLNADWGPSVSKNPYIAFRFKGAAVGDKVAVTWTDTSGATRTDEAAIT